MKAFVDKDTCIGCELCASIAPDVFQMDDEDGKSYVIVDAVPAGLEADTQDACDSCPVDAISVEE